MTLAIADLVDVSTFPPPGPDGDLQLDLTGQRIAGARVVLEWVARSWFTPRGSLPRSPSRGVDVRLLENVTLGPGDLDRWRAALCSEAEAVEFVARCAVAIELVGRAVTIAANVTLVDGKTYPLAVRIAAAAATVTIGGAQ